MICPLMSANDLGNVTCLKEECAWWLDDDNFAMCAIKRLARKDIDKFQR